jgi:2,3-bisphosphoglycerate-independent phosphoglycerate mutase
LNCKRISEKLNPATGIWIWDRGKKLQLPSIEQKYGVKGSVIAAVNLIKGIGICAGLESINVVGATGTLHTNYKGKGQAAIDEFKKGKNFAYVHVEAPDECSHTGDLAGKIKSLEQIDGEILKPVLDYLKNTGEPYRVLVVTDHKTLMETQTHNAEPVHDSRESLKAEEWKSFSERAGEKGLFIESGCDLADEFLKNKV